MAELVVLGTSNCIGSGSFINKIRPDSPLTIANRSVGASSSAAGLYLLDTIAPTDRGVAFLDYSINDNDAGQNLWGEANARAVVASNLRTLANRLRSMSYFPILLVLPSDFHSGADFLGERLHQEICLKEKITFLNVRRVFREALSSGIRKEALMSDDWHMSEPAAEHVARFLAAVINRMARNRPRKRLMKSSSLATRIIPAAEIFPREALVKRQSSLRGGQYGRLGPQNPIRVDAKEGERIAGLMINVGANGGSIAIRGPHAEATKSLRFVWSRHQPPVYFSMLVDVRERVTGGEEGVLIEMASPGEAPTEPTIHARPLAPDPTDEIEIEGVLLTGVEEVVHEFLAPDYRELPVDLAVLPEARTLLDALTRLC